MTLTLGAALTALGVCVAASALVQVPSATARAKPNFSGTWKLNVQRSGPILPRGLEALTMVIDHRDPSIKSSETRKVAGQVKVGSQSEATIDGREHVNRSKPGSTEKTMQVWSGEALLKHWELTENGTTYVSDIKQTLLEGGKVLVMSEHYHEPGLERIRDWVFEKQ